MKLLKLANKIIIVLIGWYQIILSPFFGFGCRFYPSCSQYAKISYLRFGFWRGTILTIFRLSRCHPWHQGGIDEVPECSNK